jgi:hypothetical protein
METVIITKNKEHIISTETMIGEDLVPGLDIRLNIYEIVGTTETDVLLDQSLTESTKKPGVYLFPWTPSSDGNYRVDIYEEGNVNELAQTFNIIKVTETDVDELSDALGITPEHYIDIGSIQTFQQGDTALLEILVYNAQGGVLTDADSTPTINVVNSSGVTIANGTATKVSIGRYSFSYKLTNGAILGNWRYIWNLTVDSENLSVDKRTQLFSVIAKSCVPGTDERLGFGFDNPDMVSNDGWGAIVTPDELRYIYAFGNDAVSPSGHTITDETLKWYIDKALANVEKDLNIIMKKRKYFHRDIGGQPARNLEDLGYVDPGDEDGIDYFLEDPYDFNGKEFREYIWIKTKRRPIIEVTKAEFIDLTGATIINLKDFGMKVNYDRGSIQFFPNQGALASLALISSNSVIFNNALEARGSYPDAFILDYTVGFKTAKHLWAKHSELATVVGNLAAINFLNDFGDGKSPGLASSSISLAGISESFSTTQSATNALFGAHILNLEKQLKEFYKENKNKYSGLLFTAL